MLNDDCENTMISGWKSTKSDLTLYWMQNAFYLKRKIICKKEISYETHCTPQYYSSGPRQSSPKKKSSIAEKN